MGGKSGGNSGAGAAIQYGNKAIELQKQIYDQTRQDYKPYQQAGNAGLEELMFRLGLGGKGIGSDPNVSAAQKGIDEANAAIGRTAAINYDPNSRGATANVEAQKARDQAQLAAAQKAYDDAYSTANTAAKTAAASDPNYGSLLKTFNSTDFQNDPGYQFRLSEGQKGVERQLSAAGKYLTPEATKALQQYNQDYASTEYGNAYNRDTADKTNIYNRLAGITGTGQSATGSIANAGSNYANQAGETYQGIGNSITAANQANAANSGSFFNTLLGAGATLGGAYLSGGGSLFAPATASSLGTVGKGFANYYTSDARLKTNIIPLGTQNGHNVYSFNYKANPNRRYVGVIAQEVMQKNPEAVIQLSDGVLAVNYDAIGVNFHEVQ